MTDLSNVPENTSRANALGFDEAAIERAVAEQRALFDEVMGKPAPAFGAHPQDWAHLAIGLELAEDLLPVVSNPSATISPGSSMRDLGKTPSLYNDQRQVVGIKGWTQHRATDAEVERWSGQPDYGICLQTRLVRALDVDVTDAGQAAAVRSVIAQHLGELPERTRANSSKFAQLVLLPGDMPKRRIITAHGAIEFLGTGQQLVVAGTHPSGVRYEWAGGLPSALREITLQQLDALWDDLQARFGTEPATQATASVKAAKLAGVHEADPRARFLFEAGRVLKADRDGKLHIECPWSDQHTSESLTSTTYFPANTGGYERGHYECLHAHCADRTEHEFDAGVGFAPVLPITEDVPSPPPRPSRFPVIRADEFMHGPEPEWLIDGVLPAAELLAVYGPPACGKSFLTSDMALAVALGLPWRGKDVRQGNVVYIVAEGSGGFRTRLAAYAKGNGLDPVHIGDHFRLIAGAPDFSRADDISDVIASVQAAGGASLIVVDTWARVLGGDENSAQDVNLALKHCKALHAAVGATVLLVHHTGKDAQRGMRGSTTLLAAVDCAIEVVRVNDKRAAVVAKQKDGEDGAEYGFGLLRVELGYSAKGKPLSSCVIEHFETGGAARVAKKRLGKNETLALRVMARLQPPGAPGVFNEELARECIKDLPEPAAGVKDRRRGSVLDAINSLVFASQLLQVGDRLTLPADSA